MNLILIFSRPLDFLAFDKDTGSNIIGYQFNQFFKVIEEVYLPDLVFITSADLPEKEVQLLKNWIKLKRKVYCCTNMDDGITREQVTSFMNELNCEKVILPIKEEYFSQGSEFKRQLIDLTLKKNEKDYYEALSHTTKAFRLDLSLEASLSILNYYPSYHISQELFESKLLLLPIRKKIDEMISSQSINAFFKQHTRNNPPQKSDLPNLLKELQILLFPPYDK